MPDVFPVTVACASVGFAVASYDRPARAAIGALVAILALLTVFS